MNLYEALVAKHRNAEREVENSMKLNAANMATLNPRLEAVSVVGSAYERGRRDALLGLLDAYKEAQRLEAGVDTSQEEIERLTKELRNTRQQRNAWSVAFLAAHAHVRPDLYTSDERTIQTVEPEHLLRDICALRYKPVGMDFTRMRADLAKLREMSVGKITPLTRDLEPVEELTDGEVHELLPPRSTWSFGTRDEPGQQGVRPTPADDQIKAAAHLAVNVLNSHAPFDGDDELSNAAYKARNLLSIALAGPPKAPPEK